MSIGGQKVPIEDGELRENFEELSGTVEEH